MCYYLAVRSLYETWGCFCYSGHQHHFFLVCFLVCVLFFFFFKRTCLSGVFCHISKITLSSSILFRGIGASLSQLIWDFPVTAGCLAEQNERVGLLCFLSEPSGDLLKREPLCWRSYWLYLCSCVCMCLSSVRALLFHVCWRYYLL